MLEKFFKNKEIETAKEAVRNNPDNILKLNILATLYKKNNFFDEAIDIYERILRFDENYLPALNDLADCYLQKKQYLKAYRTLKFLYEKIPADVQIKNTLLTLQDVDCDIEAKVEILKGLVKIDTCTDLQKKLAQAYLDSGQFSKSAAVYENLVFLEEKTEYLAVLGDIYQKLNKFEKAAEFLERLMLTNDFGLIQAQNLAEIYFKLRRFDEAKGLYELLIENCPNKTKIFKEKIAQILMEENNPDAAITITQDVINSDKYDVEAKFLQVNALIEKKEYDEALEFLRDFYCDPVDKIVEKKIENEIVRTSILYSEKLRAQKKFVEAIDIISLALRYDENNKNIYLELAEISNAIKDFSTAREYMKIANEL